MKMEFSHSVFFLLCLLPETSSLTLGTTETCGIIGKEFTLVCNFSGDSWNPSSTREWRGPPSLTLLFIGGTVQTGINGYVESIDSVNTDSAFRLHIQSLAWSNVDVPYECAYRFDVKRFSINSSTVVDYNTTHDVKTYTKGKNILATINLDAITPVPTVTALLNSPSGTSDVTLQAITITSTPNANNAALNTVNITVNYTVTDTDHNITVNLATPCGYTKSYTFEQDVETTTTMNPPDKGLSTGGVIGIVIGVLIFIIIVVVVVCICKHIKKVSVEDKTSSNMFRESSVITQAQQSWPRKLPSIEHKNPSKGKKVKKDKVKPKPADDNNDKTKKPPKKSETHQTTQNDNNHDQTEKTKGKSETNQPIENDKNHDKTENSKGKSETNQPIQNDINHDKTENTKGKSETNQPSQNDNNHDKTENAKGKSETNQPIQNDNNQDKTENTKGKSETNQPIQNDNNHDKTENTKGKSETNQPIQNDNNQDKTANTQGKSETHQPHQNDKNHNKTMKPKEKSETH